jgi:hypothetical protein
LNVATPLDSNGAHVVINIDEVNTVSVFSQSDRGIARSSAKIKNAERPGTTALRQGTSDGGEKSPIIRLCVART